MRGLVFELSFGAAEDSVVGLSVGIGEGGGEDKSSTSIESKGVLILDFKLRWDKILEMFVGSKRGVLRDICVRGKKRE